MIRPVEAWKDARSITAIYNEYVLHSTATFETVPLQETEMLRRINDIASAFPYLVYEQDGSVTGFCYAHLWRERAAYRHTLETTVYVSPQCRRQGIGSRLLECLIRECRKLDCHALIACITSENTASIALHERFGFRRVSHFKEVGYKSGRWLDVSDLELMLTGRTE